MCIRDRVEVEEVQPDQNSDETPIDEIDVSMEDMYSDESTYYLSEQKSEMPLPDRHTLLEDLIDQLKDLNLNENEKEVAEEIIWNTNEKGYLDTDLILIADRFDLLENEVEPILHKVQRLNPLGIGSRSLEECLMIQLEDEKGSLSHNIVNKYFDDFMHKRYEKIQEKYNSRLALINFYNIKGNVPMAFRVIDDGLTSNELNDVQKKNLKSIRTAILCEGNPPLEPIFGNKTCD